MSSQWDPEVPEEDNGSSAEEEYLQSIQYEPEEIVPEVEEEGQINNNNNKQNKEGSIMSDNLSINQSQTGINEIPNNSSIEDSVNTSGVLTFGSIEEATPRFNSSNNRTIGNLKNAKRQISKKIERMKNEIADYGRMLDRGYFIKKNKDGKTFQEQLDSAARFDIKAKMAELQLLVTKSKVKLDEKLSQIKKLSLIKKESNNSKLKKFRIERKVYQESTKAKQFILLVSQNGSRAIIGNIQQDIISGSEESATQKLKNFIKEKIDLSKKGIKVSSPEDKKVFDNIIGYIKNLQLT